MAIKPPDQKEEKKGLLQLGFHEGDSIPYLDVPNRVGKEGELLWRFRDPIDVWLDTWYDVRQFLAQQQDQVYTAIFRSQNSLARALMGFHVSLDWGRGWPLAKLPVPSTLDAIRSVPKLWEAAPGNVQTMIFHGAALFARAE